MVFSNQDIIERRERDGRKAVWIIQSCILTICGITENYLRMKARRKFLKSVRNHQRKQLILPDTGASYRYAKFHKDFYYDYDRLPVDQQAKLPSKEEILEKYKADLAAGRESELKMQIRTALESNYKPFLMAYQEVATKYTADLAKACAAVIAVIEYVKENNQDTKPSLFWKDLGKVVKSLNVKYLPTNHRRLKDKVIAVLDGDDVTNVIKLPRQGNVNSLKYEDKELISWMMQMRSLPANYSSSHIIRKMRMMCSMTGKSTPSASWFSGQLATPRTKFLTISRYGKGRRADRGRGYVPIENAIHAGDCWQVDGTRINMMGHKDKDGKTRFLYIIAITDVHSGDIIGQHFDYKEDRWGYVHALKMACNATGYLPYELVVDRFPGHNTEEWKTLTGRLEMLGTKVTVTSKKTGKAKVERLFSTLQTVFMQDSKYYYGEGVQSRNEYAHRAPEYIAKMQKEINKENWDFTAAYLETMRIIDNYRSTKYSEYSKKFANVNFSPRSLHDMSDKPHVAKVEKWDYVQLFGTEKSVTIRNAGMIITTIQKIEYVFRVDNLDTVVNHKKVRICYDMEDLGTVEIYEDSNEINRKYLGTATEQRAVQLYGPTADHSELGKAKKRIKDIEEHRAAMLADDTHDGGEVELMLAGMQNKGITSDAESRWLDERGSFHDNGEPRILNQKTTEEPEDFDDEIIDVDPRSLY